MSAKLDHQAADPKPHPQVWQQFAAHLRELVELLAAEYEAIKNRDVEAITSFAKTKELLVSQIDICVAALGNSLEALIENPQALTDGPEIIELLRQCKTANRVNGAAIETSQTFAGALLDILRGRAAGEATYTSNGRLGRARGTNASLIRI